MHEILIPCRGYYGEFGGAFVPELLVTPIKELEETFDQLKSDPEFNNELNHILKHYAGRATPLTPAVRFSQAIFSKQLSDAPLIVLKREDLLHTGAHKLNNALGQCLLAKRLGKARVICETGAGQHGVATATACAYLGLDCCVYMGSKDIKRQQPNVARMTLLGAQVISVTTGAKTLKDAVNEALRDWAASFETSHYCLGSALGPHPYPEMVAYFQSVIGVEAKQQCAEQLGCLPDHIIACVGGGSNAIGIFSGFIDTKAKLIGVEAGGCGTAIGEHAARFQGGKPGVLHGCYSYALQNDEGQIAATHSISAGLDYPMIGPQHAALNALNLAEYHAVNDETALSAMRLLAQTEGIIPALESAHALGYVMQHSHKFKPNSIILINLSGRGDKDIQRTEVCDANK